jgi:hypothetical protein
MLSAKILVFMAPVCVAGVISGQTTATHNAATRLLSCFQAMKKRGWQI